jgi:iron complex outermembrane recepter protein
VRDIATVFGMLGWAVALLALVPGGAAAQVSAQEESARADTARVIPVVALGEIVVLGTRNAVTRAATVHTVEREQIDALGIRSPRDAMEHLPGVYFSRNGRNENTFRLRGFDQRQVSVFVDGVPVSLAYDGLVDISQFVGADLERVQVSHGFSSLLYGANSLGGTVSLTTRQPAGSPLVSARLEGSDHGRFFGTAEAAGGTDRLRVSVSAARERASSFAVSRDFLPTANEEGGDRSNSSYDRTRAGLRAQYLWSENHRVGLSLSGTDNRFDVPPNALSANPRFWQFPVWRKGMASVNSHHLLGEGVTLRTAVFHDRYNNVLRSFDDATYTTQTRRYAFNSEYDDYAYGFNLFPSLTLLPFGTTDAAISYRRDVHRQRDEDDPFERYATDLITLAVEQDVDLTAAISTMVGANVNLLRPLEAEGHPTRDPISQANAQWAMQVRHGDGLASRVALSRKSRFPTMKELYSSRFGQNLANPDLRSETALHGEVGVDATLAGWDASVSLFRSDVRDLIADEVVEGGLRQMQNVQSARLEGVELHVNRRGDLGSVGVNYAFLSAANTTPERASSRLSYRPAHRANLVGTYRPHERIRVGGEVSHTVRQHYQNPNSREWERLNDMTWVNLRLEHELRGGLGWYVRVDNVFDGAYFSEFGVPLPGRELSVGVRVGL